MVSRTGMRLLVDGLALVCALAVGTVATWFACSQTLMTEEVRRQEHLAAASQSVVDAFTVEIARAIEAVRATGLMAASQDHLERAEFEGFGDGILRAVPVLDSLQWIPRVSLEDFATFAMKAERQNRRAFRILEKGPGGWVPAARRPEYFPVLYSFPSESAYAGVDVATNEALFAALESSWKTQQPVASAVFKFLAKDGDKVGESDVVAVASPVCRHADTRIVSIRPAENGQAPRRCAGFVAGIVRLETLFREATFRANAQHLDVRVYDQTDAAPRLIYRALEAVPEAQVRAGENAQDAVNDMRTTVDVGGRPWDVVMQPRAGFFAGNQSRLPAIVLVSGATTTLLLCLGLYGIQRSRRRIEQVRSQEARMGVILSATNAGAWEWNQRTGEMRVNERWATMLGLAALPEFGLHVSTRIRLIHPEDVRAQEASVAEHLQGKAATFGCEMRMRHSSGAWIWVLERGALISRTADGQPEWLAGTSIDITREKELGQQIEDIRTALDAHAIVSMTDLQGVITFANDKFCEISRYGRGELIGNTHRLLNSAHHPPEFFQDIWRTIAAGATWHGEIRNRAKDGSVHWLDSTIAPILSSDGKPGQYIAIRYDITEAKHQEEATKRARQAAEAASEAKSSFLATMSHEIRTPLNGILGMLELLRVTQLNARQSDYAAKAQTATKALLHIVNDILDFSKVEAGKLELENHAFALNDLLRELSVVVSANLGTKDIEVLFAIDPGIPQPLVGDAMRLRQVLLNLLGNAIKFTQKGEVLLRVTVRSGASTADGVVELEFQVQDSGIGIPADKMDYVFEGFSQAESSTTRHFGGTGLGLSISKRFVNLMGGQLRVDSEVGRGSRFYFNARFALSLPHATAPMRAPDALERREHVVVADDNPLARSVLGDLVASLGWRADCLDSGEAVLSYLAGEAGDGERGARIFLIDWRMAGLDSWETARRIRAHAARTPQGGDAPIVFLSGNNLQELSSRIDEHPSGLIDGYLIKPITASVLYDAVLQARTQRGATVVRPTTEPTQELAGLRILLVEDNVLNQQVAVELLSYRGAQVQVAGGGQEGVDQALARDAAFDVILMDMHMPGMDGLEATRRIRAEPRMHRLPIIAMTANAMEADKQTCFAAGMVDHVAKPIDLALLVQTLLRHTRPAAEYEAVHPASLPRIEAKQAPASLAAGHPAGHDVVIDREAAIARLGGVQRLYDKFVASFVKTAPGLLLEARQCAEAGDRQSAARSLHTFKGLAATLGAESLAREAVEAEDLVRQAQPPESAGACIERLALHLAAVLRHVQQSHGVNS